VLNFSNLRYNLKEQRQLYKLRLSLMSTKQIAQGATKPGNGSQSPVKAETTPAPTAKVTPIKLDEKKDEKLSDLPPLEDRVLRVQQLSDLVAKREKLRESLKKLKSIKTSSDNRSLCITIEDSESEWETYNTDAIKACVATMEQTINSKLQEVEALIKF
jgi:hypothetical protein